MFRILTENKNQSLIKTILNRYVEGYTILPALGSWKGIPENSIAIDLVDVTSDTTRAIAKDIKEINQQDTVLVLEIPANAWYV